MADITKMTALQIASGIHAGELSVKEVLDAFYASADEKEPKVNAFITLSKEEAYAQAENVQADIDKGIIASPLAGVPVAVKDNISTKGIRTTCASKILYNYVPVFDAFVTERLKNAGMIITGKTNMDEFAMGSTTETSFFGPTDNPNAPGHVPGGSSGGSCAAVAAFEAPLALGSDTGGSIRQPAAYCGVTGLKPTYGAVSRYGLIAYGSSLDQIGPVAKDVKDCAALLEIIAGKDVQDSTSVQPEETDYLTAAGMPVKGLRVGIPKEYLREGLQPEIRDAVLKAAEVLAAAGADVSEFSLGMLDYAIPAYYVIASAEASSNLERFDGVKYGYRASDVNGLHDMYKKTRSEGFGAEVKRRIMLGSFVLSSGYYDAYYLKALRTKALIKKAFDEAFEHFDVILSPAAPTTAPVLGGSLADPIKMYLSDIYTVSLNLAGLPGITVPCGTDREGLPVGIQMVGDCFTEKTLIKAAYAYEQAAKEA